MSLSQDEYNVIVELLNKAMLRVFGKNEKLKKDVKGRAEPLLELEVDKYIAKVKSAEAHANEAEAERNKIEVHANEMERQIVAM